MKPQFVFFSMILGVSELSIIATFIPALPLLLSMVLLATSGRKYFAYFWLVQVGISLPYYYVCGAFEMNDIVPLMNLGIYSVPSSSINPTAVMVQHANLGVVVLYAVAAFGTIAAVVFGAWTFYRKVKRTLKGRVTRWNP